MIIQTNKQLRERDSKDHYPTPHELCDAVVKALPAISEYPCVIDPGAGAGVWGDAVVNRWKQASVVGVEVDTVRFSHPSSSYYSWVAEDYLKYEDCFTLSGFDLAIGNPPYGISADGTKDRKLAEKFVRKSWELIREGGYIVFLLRMGFLEGQQRAKSFWPKYPLKDLYVLSRRPSFTNDFRTDATAYSVFVWQKGYVGKTTLDWLQWDYEK